MAWNVVAASTAAVNSVVGVVSMTIQPAANITVGNALLVAAVTNSTGVTDTLPPVITDSAGNTYSETLVGGYSSIMCYVLATAPITQGTPGPGGGGQPTITITPNQTGTVAVIVMEVSGLLTVGNPTVTIQEENGGQSGLSNSYLNAQLESTTPTLYADDFVVGLIAMGSPTGHASIVPISGSDPGWTSVAYTGSFPGGSELAIVCEDSGPAVGATPTLGWTWSGSDIEGFHSQIYSFPADPNVPPIIARPNW